MKCLHYSVLVTALLMSGLSQADSIGITNTITFTGSITDASCNVSLLDANGTVVGDTGTGEIKLAEVSKADLSGTNSVAMPTRFSILAKDCVLGTPAKTKISARFISNNADNLGYLNNTSTGAGSAKKVQFKLLDSAQKFIKINDPTQMASPVDIVTADPAETTIPFYVEYYSASGGATAGAVTSTVNYEMIYP